MKIKIVKIGNSRGIRIPKVYLHQTGIDGEVDLKIKNNQIILVPFKRIPRTGWTMAFKKMAQNKDDRLLERKDLSKQSSFDGDEWEW